MRAPGRRNAECTVIMHGYNRENAEMDILHAIEGNFGRMKSAKCARQDDGSPKCVMMVKFLNAESAQAMIREWNNTIVSGRFCICYLADEELQSDYTGRRVGDIRVDSAIFLGVPDMAKCGWTAYCAIQSEMTNRRMHREVYNEEIERRG